MIQKLLKYGPVVLVPAAWTATAAAHFYTVFGAYELMIAHAVMVVLMTVFLAAGWAHLDQKVLRIWRNLILLGIPAILSGLIGLSVLSSLEVLKAASILYWMISPGVALVLTGRQADIFGRAYILTGISSVLGAIFYIMQFFTPVADLLLVMVSMIAVASGQTFGILLAAYQNSEDIE